MTWAVRLCNSSNWSTNWSYRRSVLSWPVSHHGDMVWHSKKLLMTTIKHFLTSKSETSLQKWNLSPRRETSLRDAIVMLPPLPLPTTGWRISIYTIDVCLLVYLYRWHTSGIDDWPSLRRRFHRLHYQLPYFCIREPEQGCELHGSQYQRCGCIIPMYLTSETRSGK